jgi:hypothetical protein
MRTLLAIAEPPAKPEKNTKKKAGAKKKDEQAAFVELQQ